MSGRAQAHHPQPDQRPGSRTDGRAGPGLPGPAFELGGGWPSAARVTMAAWRTASLRPGRGEVRMSNGSTDVFFDVLTLAGCDVARTAWEQNLVLYFADGHRTGMGASGFDLAELPWTANWPAEKQFFLQLIDTAAGRHGWDWLAYDPPFVAAQLAAYRDMLARFTPIPSA